MNGLVPRVSQSKDSVNGGWLDNGAEGFVIVNAGSLSEPVENPVGLVSVQGTISMELVFENPFSSDNIRLGRPRNEVPSMIV